jgi:exodeoxyribonuclease V alpha subunit
MNVAPKPSIEQETAIALCSDLQNRIVGVTGGAGTGKTFVLGRAYAALCDSHSVALAAPTGRAAKRIQELTGIKALTIHRLLGFPMPDEDGIPGVPKHNRHNPIPYRVVFIDESSMIGGELYEQLMDALPPNACARFFGDNNQLPPVEKGLAPFVNILNHHPSVTLTFNYRSDDEIVSNANRILRGSIPLRNNRFEIIYDDDPLRTMLEFVKDTPDFAQAHYQIIVPTRKGNFGTLRLNPSLQVLYNATGPMLRLERADEKEAPLAVRAGDKFLWVKNDYNLNLFNGTTGSIESLDTEDGTLQLRTPDDLHTVPARLKMYSAYHRSFISYDPRRQIELGYAVTTHKSQGSEFDTVIYCVCKGHAWMLNKRNFYTAVTRAKTRLIMICDRRAMSYSVRPYKDH